jgi:hypothetical protein
MEKNLGLINQEQGRIISTKKTVDWLINHTSVRVFDPISFEGYQRHIDQNHCNKLVEYLVSHKFFLPTAIICATDREYSDHTQELFVVDGQHRIEAFKRIQLLHQDRYQEIRELELPVIILDRAEESMEIDAFITINKTSKKVDTSLALVLRNKINNPNSTDMSIPKRDYMAVEIARALNGDGDYTLRSDLWFDKIRYEGTTKGTLQLISLNAFVKSMRSLLKVVEKNGLITLRWNSEEEIRDLVTTLARDIDAIWHEIYCKWPDTFENGLEQRRIIQGSIGFTAINRYLYKRFEKQSADDLVRSAIDWIRQIRRDSHVWLPGEKYSQYSSESGFSIIAQDLYDSCF